MLVLAAVLRKKHKKAHKVLLILGLGAAALPVAMIVHYFITSAIDYRDVAYNAVEGNYNRVEELLQDGADPDKCNLNDAYSALAFLADNGMHSSNYRGEELVDMERLLLDYGADVDYRVEFDSDSNQNYENGRTPFLYAVEKCDIDSVKLFLEYGADINAADDRGYNAILLASTKLDGDEGYEMIVFLVENGCSYDQTNDDGDNALDIIAKEKEIYGDHWRQEKMQDYLTEIMD